MNENNNIPEKENSAGKIAPCPFCGDAMRRTNWRFKEESCIAVKHSQPDNGCVIGRGVYKLSQWNRFKTKGVVGMLPSYSLAPPPPPKDSTTDAKEIKVGNTTICIIQDNTVPENEFHFIGGGYRHIFKLK